MPESNTARHMPKLKTSLAVALASVALLILGALIGRYELLPIAPVANIVKSIMKDIRVFIAGEDRFVQKTLDKHYHKNSQPSAPTARILDTSRLPLQLTTVSLANTGQFAASEELVGGSLTRVESSLFIMDKLGNIFNFKNNVMHRMDYGVFPNGAGASIRNSVEPLMLVATKALYIAYDSARGTLYASLQKFNESSRHARFNISAISIDRDTLEKKSDWRTVFETEDIPNDASFRGATGGKLIVAGNYLYFTIGDYNFGQVPEKEFELVAQSAASSFGKIYEHDLTTRKTRVKSIGHRNPQGLVFTKDGKLIDAEHGPEGGDELNIVVDGKNYGWPYRTYGTDYGTFNWPIKFKAPGVDFVEPLFSWVPSAAISPVIQISQFSDRWNGDLLVGSLKAQTLFRLKMANDRVILSEPIWVGHRIRDIVEMPDQIVLMTDDPALVFVSVDERRLKENSKLQKNVEFIPALAKCLNCHHFGETNPSHLAPTLANIMNKRIASDSFQRYSVSLTKKGGNWDEESLTKFIRNPNEFAPGSGMPALGLSEPQIKEVVSALGTRERK